jgi:hypothetical protein
VSAREYLVRIDEDATVVVTWWEELAYRQSKATLDRDGIGASTLRAVLRRVEAGKR